LLLIVLFQSCSVFSSGVETSEDPGEAKIITSDIDHFYQGFDLAIKDSTRAEKVFNEYYFRKGSDGLDDFYKTKIQSKARFSKFVLAFKDYYQSIRSDISDLNDLEDEIYFNFQEFEKLYP